MPGTYTVAHAILVNHKELTTTGSSQEEADEDRITAQGDGKFLALAQRLIPTLCDEMLWKCALSSGCPDETTELISNHFQPNQITKLSVCKVITELDVRTKLHPIIITVRNLKWISQVVPHLEQFTVGDLSQGIENVDAFVSLMRCMAKNANSIKDLSLGLTSSWIREENGPAIHALQHMLATRESLENVQFSFGGQGISDRCWSAKDQNNSMSLQKKELTIVQHLQLKHFKIQCKGGEPLRDVLMIPSLPVRRLTLENFHVHCSTLVDGENYNRVNQQYLEELNLTNFTLGKVSITKAIFQYLANFGSLRRFELSITHYQAVAMRLHDPQVDVTEEVVQLISQAPKLEELVLLSRHIQMDLSIIYDALTPNYMLKVFRVPAPNDFATTNPQHSDSGREWKVRDKIMYRTDLNRYGRQRAGHPQTNKSTIVQLLQAVPTNINSAMTTSIHYGLLHQKPDAWSTY